MLLSPTQQSSSVSHGSRFRRAPARHVLPLLGLWLAIFFASLFSPPLLDDADATHAQAAHAMVTTGDWVTLHVDGIRYLEKPPLPYWLVALSFCVFGFNTFAVHLPLALAVLALAALGYLWAGRAFGTRAAFYTALATLTCTGVFLFTRVFIPEALLSLFLGTTLYMFLLSLDPSINVSPRPKSARTGAPIGRSLPEWGGFADVAERPALLAASPYIMWTALALAVLTKGLVALAFFFGTALLYLALTGTWRQWRRLKPFSGIALFLLIAAPWHILASLRNTGGENGHGFAWFYFINEHVLRFLGRRIPRDYNKLPGYLYWSLHLVWLFPWSLFAPLAAIFGWRSLRTPGTGSGAGSESGGLKGTGFSPSGALAPEGMAGRTILLLAIYSTLILVFFSISTNQEYYTFPIYLPLLMLICASIAKAERTLDPEPWALKTLLFGHIAYTVLGLAVSAALAYGLWSARHLAFVPDIGDLLAHRGVGDYTLAMSHLFDITGHSFAALRLPASLALIAFAVGPAAAWVLRRRREHFAATVTVALTSAVFLIAAHAALVRFAPMLSSQDFAERIEDLRAKNAIAPDTDILLFGDQAYGSSIPFYLHQRVSLVDGRSSSMLFGSTFPDAPKIFLTSHDLLTGWGQGHRKILFVPLEKRDEVDRLLGSNQVILEETSGKLLITDRPLATTPTASYR